MFLYEENLIIWHQALKFELQQYYVRACALKYVCVCVCVVLWSVQPTQTLNG